MSFESLQDRHTELIKYLEDGDYSYNVITGVSCEIRRILENGQTCGWQDYRDIYHTYVENGLSESTLHNKRYYLRMIERFDTKGEFPDRTSRRSCMFESDRYMNLPAEFRELIEFYREYGSEKGNKQSTIYTAAANTVMPIFY